MNDSRCLWLGVGLLLGCADRSDDDFGTNGDLPTVSGEDTVSSATSADATGTGGAETTSATATTQTTTSQTTTSATTASDSTGDDEPNVPPTGARAILPWLEAGSYQNWPAESDVHPSSGPHGSVRTFVNQTLFDSMAAASTIHPADSAAVKELYSGGNMIGWAVGVRLDDGPGEQAWYWYELLNGSVVADGTGVGLCANCHAGGTDYVLTPFPLQ